MGIPILHGGELIGLLAIGNKETDYGETDRKEVSLIAQYIAPVLHARLQRNAQECARRDRQRCQSLAATLEGELESLKSQLEHFVVEKA